MKPSSMLPSVTHAASNNISKQKSLLRRLGGVSRTGCQLRFEPPQPGLYFRKTVVAVDVAHRRVARRCDDSRRQRTALHLILNMAQEAMLDAHAERPATDGKTGDFPFDNHGRADKAIVAQPVRHFDREQTRIGTSRQG